VRLDRPQCHAAHRRYVVGGTRHIRLFTDVLSTSLLYPLHGRACLSSGSTRGTRPSRLDGRLKGGHGGDMLPLILRGNASRCASGRGVLFMASRSFSPSPRFSGGERRRRSRQIAPVERFEPRTPRAEARGRLGGAHAPGEGQRNPQPVAPR
jgi:hypothetical protein